MLDFYRTAGGRQFFDGHVPSLVSSLRRLSEAAEILAKNVPAQPEYSLLREPLSKSELDRACNDGGRISVTVPIEFSELIELNLEGLNNVVESLIVGNSGTLSDLSYRVVGFSKPPDSEFGLGGAIHINVVAKFSSNTD